MIQLETLIYILQQTYPEEKGRITGCAETKNNGETVVICLQTNNYILLQNLKAHALIFAFSVDRKYRDKQRE